ncbi:unnamed protein product [Orchesella dallaii]|uniref:Protein quiver n=1 Tax=Orchesella dallaii TaxID=48710 RepID=A0ABP1PX00_9HEXA
MGIAPSSSLTSILKSIKTEVKVHRYDESNKTKRLRRDVPTARARATRDMFSTVCSNIPKARAVAVGQAPPPLAPQLKCYQCRSNTSQDLEPKCDNRLFKYLRHSEKARMRITCTKGREDFCIKITKQKLGQRITERGCFGDEIKYGLNKSLQAAPRGCATFKQDGFITTVCLCKNNLCNEAVALFRTELCVTVLSVYFLLYLFVSWINDF